MVCSGNKLEYCGAGNRLSVYNLTAVTNTTITSSITSLKTSTSSVKSTSTSTAKSTSTFTKQTSTSTTTKTSTTAKSTPSLLTVTKTGKWTFQDCILDGGNNPLFAGFIVVKNVTPEKCLAACLAKSYKYCGLNGGNCYGSKSPPSKNTAAPSTTAGPGPVARGCNISCAGNTTVACGGSKVIDYYTYLSSVKSVSPSKTQ